MTELLMILNIWLALLLCVREPMDLFIYFLLDFMSFSLID